MKEKLCKNMLLTLIKKLEKESNIDLKRITEELLWEKYKEGSAYFVIVNHQIVGCCAVWSHVAQMYSKPMYLELGTVWTQQQDRAFILKELGSNIARIAAGQKIMGFCKQLQLARYFRMSSVFPFTTIANWQTCPREVIESIPQFRGWHPQDTDTENKYSRLLYFMEEEEQISSWYLVYQ